MGQANRLTYEAIAAWSSLTEQYPTPGEVAALMKIDGALRGFGGGSKAKKAPHVDPPWPEKKGGNA